MKRETETETETETESVKGFKRSIWKKNSNDNTINKQIK